MAERNTPQTRFLHRFRPPIPSFFSSRGFPRPTSSHYSGDGLRGAPGTVIGGGGGGVESPKSPDFAARTWTQRAAGVAAPQPVVHAPRRHGSSSSSSSSRSRSSEEEEEGHRERRRRRREHRRDGSGRSGSGRSGRSHGSSSSHRSRRTRDEGRRARRERRRGTDGSESRGSRSTRSDRRPPPKHFLFCFPWIKSRRIRSHILRSFVSGLFLALSLAVCKCPRPAFGRLPGLRHPF
jgi:hypothetical protein